MSTPNALAVTGLVLFIVAGVLTLYTALFALGRAERLAASAAWAAFALACVCFIGAAWWAAA